MPRNNRYKKHKAKKPVNKLDLTILVFNIIAVIALLLSYLAPETDPRSFIAIPVLGFVYLPLVAVNILFCIYWPITKKGAYALISLLTVLLGFNTISMNIKLRKATPLANKSTQAIRIMEYNVNVEKNIDLFDTRPTDTAIYKIIRDVKPDILTLEEFVSYGNTQIDSVKKSMDANYCYFKSFRKRVATNNEIGYVGNAIFSKYPIMDTGYVSGPELLQIHAVYADIKKDNDTIRVYALHLSPVDINGGNKKDYLKGKINVGQSSFILGRLSSAFLTRSYQVDRIKRNIDSCNFSRIIAGDFNDTPNSFSVNTLGDNMKSSFGEQGAGLVTTYFSRFPLHIDHIFVSNKFNVVGYCVLNKRLSDHKPVIADISQEK